MSPDSSHEQLPESSYPELVKPEFKSQIPEHLLANASPAEKHMMAQLSRLASFADWSVEAHLSTNGAVRRTNGRLLKAEAKLEDIELDKKVLNKSWKMIVAVGGGAAGLVSAVVAIYQAFKSV